ncbi:hypothetical protein [Comamonas faecalis]
MTTFIVVTVAVLSALALLGGVILFIYLCAMAAGRAVGWVLGAGCWA